MFERRVIPVILLVILGMIGCAPSTSRYARPNPFGDIRSAPTPHEPAKINHAEILNRSLDTASSVSIAPAASAPIIAAKPSNVTAFDPAVKTQPKIKQATLKQKPAPSRTASSEFLEPQALTIDDHLLELFEKEGDKAPPHTAAKPRLQFSPEILNHPKVKYFIHHYARTTKHHFSMLLEKSGRYMPMLSKVLNEEGLPEELGYLAMIESGYETHVSSPQGAGGLWQFVPSTAQKLGLRIDRWVDERRDPVKSTRAAAAYLKELHQFFGRWYLATAAYNAGPGTINRALESTGAKDYWSLSSKSILSDETRDFVPKLVAVALIAADPKKYGFRNIKYEAPIEFEEILLDRPMSLTMAANMAQTRLAVIKDLNPALLQNSTPPDQIKFPLRVPSGKAETFAKALADMPATEPTQVVTHEVKKGDTLYDIARRYGQGVRELMSFNGLANTRLRIGQKLKVLIGRTVLR